MDQSKVWIWVIVIIVIIIIIGLLIWWACSNGNNGHHPEVEPKHIKCVEELKRNLDQTAPLTRIWIVETFNGGTPCGESTLCALEKLYSGVYSQYFGCSVDCARQATQLSMSKYPLYAQVIRDQHHLSAAKAEAHNINRTLAKLLESCGQKKGCQSKSRSDSDCESDSKLVQILDAIDKATFDQIIFIHQDNCTASLDSYYAANAATTALLRWLIWSYCQRWGIDAGSWRS